MRILFIILLLIPMVSFSQSTITLVDADVKAFPTAMGHGKITTGGRGQTVYEVINLNNSGAGSFRDAVSSSNRIVVFKTSGLITLTSQLISSANNLTIAGETAPGDGVTIHGYGTNFRGQNIIIRHIRFRPGDDCDGTDNDAIRFVGNSAATGAFSNYMVDHVSASWGDDENIAFETGDSGTRSITNATVQNSILSEPFQSKNMILYGHDITNISVLRNLMSNAGARYIRVNSKFNPSDHSSFEEINNVIYAFTEGVVVKEGTSFDVVGNIFYDAYNSPCCGEIRIADTNSGDVDNVTDGTSVYYQSDNTLDGGAIAVTSDSNATIPTMSGARVVASEYTPWANSVVQDSVLAQAGAMVGIGTGIDALDQHQIDDVLNGSSGVRPSAESGTIGLPTYAAISGYTDTDSDGLSDDYETAQGGTTTSISATTRPATATIGNGNTVDQSGVTSYASSGYTHLDIFLADLANDWENFTSTPDEVTPPGLTANPKGIRVGTTGGGAYLGTTKIKG